MTQKLTITSSTKELIEGLSLPFLKMEKSKQDKILK